MSTSADILPGLSWSMGMLATLSPGPSWPMGTGDTIAEAIMVYGNAGDTVAGAIMVYENAGDSVAGAIMVYENAGDTVAFVPFIASSSSIKSDVLLKGGTLCWPPSLPWLRSQSKKRPGRAGMISGGWREISL